MPSPTGNDVLIPGLMAHVERAGVHSGDSIAVFPPQELSRPTRGSSSRPCARICLAVGVRGLVNAQFIVREDGVYVLEVNPRASRTVPFLSKVTGVPMVALATRVGQGSSLAELGWPDGVLTPPRLRGGQGAGVLDGQAAGRRPQPGPRHAVDRRGHRPPRGRRAWPWPRPSWRPRCGRRCRPREAPRPSSPWRRGTWASLAELAAALAHVGYGFVATPGTAAELRRLGHAVREAALLGTEGAGVPDILEVIASGEVSFVVNTPAPRSGAVLDAAAIRHAAVAEGILCLTDIDTAVAAARSLDPDVQARVADVRSLSEWLQVEPRSGTSRS